MKVIKTIRKACEMTKEEMDRGMTLTDRIERLERSLNRVRIVAFITAVVLFSSFVLGSGEAKASPSDSTLYIEVQSEVEGENGRGKCSATAISSTTLLTARHCVQGRSIVQITVNGTLVQVKQIAVDGSDHLMIQLASDHFAQWSKIGKPAALGEVVYIVANPGPQRRLLRRGYVSGKDSGSPDEAYTLYDLNAFPGDSGAAIFNKQGKIVGVVSYVHGYIYGPAYMKMAGSMPLLFTKEQYALVGVKTR